MEAIRNVDLRYFMSVFTVGFSAAEIADLFVNWRFELSRRTTDLYITSVKNALTGEILESVIHSIDSSK
jgi:hypothetical protein